MKLSVIRILFELSTILHVFEKRILGNLGMGMISIGFNLFYRFLFITFSMIDIQ